MKLKLLPILLVALFAIIGCAEEDEAVPDLRPCLLYEWADWVEFDSLQCGGRPEYLLSDGEKFYLDTWYPEDGACYEVQLSGWVETCHSGTITRIKWTEAPDPSLVGDINSADGDIYINQNGTLSWRIWEIWD